MFEYDMHDFMRQDVGDFIPVEPDLIQQRGCDKNKSTWQGKGIDLFGRHRLERELTLFVDDFLS